VALTDAQLAIHAARAGWRGGDLVVAVAVAMAESGGDPNAHATVGEDSRGLWQMNVRAHPDLEGKNLYDPQVNADAAYALWKRSGWGPWSAHNNGAYLLFLPAATAAAASGDVVSFLKDPVGASKSLGDAAVGSVPLPGVLDTGRVLGGFLSDLQNPVIWQRILKVAIGAALMTAGMWLIVQTQVITPLGEKAGKVVGLTKGKVT
jgi:hypothetical protein